MRALLLPLAACAVLAGCATYGDPYYGYGGHPQASVGIYSGYPGYYDPYPSYPVYDRRTHDRDRDGIPNRVDPDRDNDGIPNRADRDRDNDGVPNRQDARPNNPRRH
jgi:hypothetical protein